MAKQKQLLTDALIQAYCERLVSKRSMVLNDELKLILEDFLAKTEAHYTKLMEQEYERGRKDERERIIAELSERIRVDDEGAVIIRVGTQTESGVEFNDWWRMFREQSLKGE